MKALEFSLSDDLEGIDVERQVGDDPFEPAILILKRAYLRYVADFKAAIFGLPLVEGLRADTVLAAQLLGIRAGFGFFDDADDLRFGEARLSQGGFLSRPKPQDFCREKRTTLLGARQQRQASRSKS